MPYPHKKSFGHSYRFCHSIIAELVQKNKLTPDRASRITLEEFNASALSHFSILHLVYCDLISAELALSLSLEDVKQSALSNRDIFHLVETDRMSIELALATPIEEIENPIAYLENKPNKTKQQIRKLQLYETYQNIAPIYVEMIVLHEFNQHRTAAEDKELTLLLNPNTRAYANRMVILEFFASRSERNVRELDLLHNVYARDYTENMIRLEFKPNKSIEDEIALEALYLKVCCKIPYESFRMRIIKDTLEEAGVINPNPIQGSCGAELRFGRAVPTALTSIGIFASNNQRLMTSMKTFIDRVIQTELISCYLEINNTPTQLRNTEAMQTYIKNKIDEFRFGILKFFTMSNAPPYSENNVRIMVENIRQKLVKRELTLNYNEYARMSGVPAVP